jgi:HPt (histidine-containing phosphotransfer) domain-containing protein
LIPDYLENRRKDIQAIQAAIRQSDFETIRTLGHRMKGSGGGYGFEAITRIGASLETAAKSQKMEEVRKHFLELVDFVQRVKVVFE